MKKLATILLSALIPVAAMAQPVQKEQKTMKKFENQIPQQGRGNARTAYLGQSIDEMIYEFMESESIPGLSLAIVQAPYIPRVVGYGVTNLEQGNLSATKTVWPLGPISQAYAAVAVMQLYEKGKLDIEAPISNYLKGLPNSWQSVTAKQLMQHSSGIPDYRMQAGFDPSLEYTPEQLLKRVEAVALDFTPGEEVAVSATNFLLLTQLVERTSKLSYHDFVWKYQIDYLGLKQTMFSEDLKSLKQEEIAATNNRHKIFTMDKAYISPAETTTGYTDDGNGRLVAAKATTSSALPGFGDIWASAENVSHWDIALAGGILISKPENRDLIYKPTTLASGKVVPAMAGWHFYNHNGLMDIKGTLAGHSAFLSRFTAASELVCVTLLANREGIDFTALARKIAAAFDSKLGAGTNEKELFAYESQFDVDTTISRIEKNLKAANIPVFALFDHGGNAAGVDMELNPTKVIVFGAPKVGTKLMQENPSISIELPLKISVYQDKEGSVWAVFPQMQELAARYDMEHNPIVGRMQQMLEQLVIRSASIY